jgi:hypothetical protein
MKIGGFRKNVLHFSIFNNIFQQKLTGQKLTEKPTHRSDCTEDWSFS